MARFGGGGGGPASRTPSYFPNVAIRRNALVSHSVVLNGNRIGSGTEIYNALILPYTSDAPRPTPNIGDNCAIGGKTSSMKNTDFPTHIRDGIAVIGTNADIPNGFQAEAASYVAPGVPASALRRLKVLRRGTSILEDATRSGRENATRSGRAGQAAVGRTRRNGSGESA